MKSLVLLLPLSLLLIAGCEVGGPPTGAVPANAVSKRSGLQAPEPERRFISNGVGNQWQQRDVAAGPRQLASEPAVPDPLADASGLKINLASETVTLAGGRSHTLRSCVVRRANGVKYLEISPNGRYLVLANSPSDGGIHQHHTPWEPSRGLVYLIDMREGKLIKKLKAGCRYNYDDYHGYNCHIVFSPDSCLAASILQKSEVEVFGIGPGGKSLPLEDAKGPVPMLVRWSPDGSFLGCIREDTDADPPRRFVDVWDGKTGKKLCRIGGPLGSFVFPCKGKTVLTKSGDLCRLWDVHTGKMMGQGKASDIFEDIRVRLSTAGRLAAFPRYPRSPYRLKEEKEGRIVLTGRWTGKELLTLSCPEPSWPRHWVGRYPRDVRPANFSSRNFLIAQAYSGNFGERVDRFAARVWDLTDLPPEPRDASGKLCGLSAEELDETWGEIGDGDNNKAFWAKEKLLDTPGQLPAFLDPLIKPVLPLPPGQVKQWIGDLDSPRFQARQAAEQALTDHPDLALPALEGRLSDKKDLPLELRLRAERIIDRIREEPVAGETGRLLWVVELLEQWGTPEAKTLLMRLASGAPDAWVTREAKASLELLDRKK